MILPDARLIVPNSDVASVLTLSPMMATLLAADVTPDPMRMEKLIAAPPDLSAAFPMMTQSWSVVQVPPALVPSAVLNPPEVTTARALKPMPTLHRAAPAVVRAPLPTAVFESPVLLPSAALPTATQLPPLTLRPIAFAPIATAPIAVYLFNAFTPMATLL